MRVRVRVSERVIETAKTEVTRSRPSISTTGIAQARAIPEAMSSNSQLIQQRRSALVLYGSETGNSQEVAEELGALTERLHFKTHVAELNQYKPVRFLPSPAM